MKIHLYHGRLDPNGPGTDLDGNATGDWGFDGPELVGIHAVDFTYGDWMLIFDGANNYAVAEDKTGWIDGDADYSLVIETSERGDLIQTWSNERTRNEYFGDFMLEAD